MDRLSFACLGRLSDEMTRMYKEVSREGTVFAVPEHERSLIRPAAFSARRLLVTVLCTKVSEQTCLTQRSQKVMSFKSLIIRSPSSEHGGFHTADYTRYTRIAQPNLYPHNQAPYYAWENMKNGPPFPKRSHTAETPSPKTPPICSPIPRPTPLCSFRVSCSCFPPSQFAFFPVPIRRSPL